VYLATALPLCRLDVSFKFFLICYGLSLKANLFFNIFSVFDPFTDAAVVFDCLDVASKYF
jgi:hypothetical protein